MDEDKVKFLSDEAMEGFLELMEIEDYEEVSPDVCQGCGSYFNYVGGNQLCHKCRKH